MKIHTTILTFLILIQGLSDGAETPTVIVKKAKIAQQNNAEKNEGKPDAEFRLSSVNENFKLPDLTIPTFSYGMRTRIVDVRVSENRIEVAIQLDELGIDYSDYKFADGKWVLQEQKRVCTLNGTLARVLSQVDILEGGAVEVKFLAESKPRKSSWDDELLNKDNQGEANQVSERYLLKNKTFKLDGAPVKIRPVEAAE